MIEKPTEYQNKTICIEGFIAYSLWDYKEWRRDNAGVFIYPIPCGTDTEKSVCYALVDDLHATESVILVSDEPLPTQEGTHIRAYGVPSFYEALDGGCPEKVHILVNKFEILGHHSLPL